MMAKFNATLECILTYYSVLTPQLWIKVIVDLVCHVMTSTPNRHAQILVSVAQKQMITMQNMVNSTTLSFSLDFLPEDEEKALYLIQCHKLDSF